MNAREANELREALTKLEHGPGSGWLRMIAGTDEIGPARTPEERTRSLEIWLESWITPAIRAVVDRYWRPNAAARREIMRRPTETKKLRDTLREGEERQARGVSPTGAAFAEGEESAHYWTGFYHSIARQAIARLEELEARLDQKGGRA